MWLCRQASPHRARPASCGCLALGPRAEGDGVSHYDTATISDNDYVARTGTLTLAPGETTKTITIDANGDHKKEADETFYLDPFSNSSNSLFTKNRGLGTILNDD